LTFSIKERLRDKDGKFACYVFEQGTNGMPPLLLSTLRQLTHLLLIIFHQFRTFAGTRKGINMGDEGGNSVSRNNSSCVSNKSEIGFYSLVSVHRSLLRHAVATSE